MALATSPKMRAMIEAWEGKGLEAYQDSVGVWTIGFGHTGPDVHPGQTISSEQADALLAADLHKFEMAVLSMVDMAHTTQNQFDALVSFAYNLGSGALAESSLLRYHKQGQYNAAAGEFVKWDHAGGQVLAGLLRRRKGEAVVYISGQYE